MASRSIDQRVAANVRAEMGRYNFTQTSLATKLGKNQQYLSRRLSGQVPFDVSELQEIADALGISMVSLIDGSKASA